MKSVRDIALDAKGLLPDGNYGYIAVARVRKIPFWGANYKVESYLLSGVRQHTHHFPGDESWNRKIWELKPNAFFNFKKKYWVIAVDNRELIERAHEILIPILKESIEDEYLVRSVREQHKYDERQARRMAPKSKNETPLKYPLFSEDRDKKIGRITLNH